MVDVGGGLGHVSLEIAKAYPSLQIVLVDRPLVVEQAKPVNVVAVSPHPAILSSFYINVVLAEQPSRTCDNE